jgi:hypothetical protein
MDYSYAIESVDAVQKTMVVKYMSTGLETTMLNISIPAVGADLDAHIRKYAPVQKWIAAGVTPMEVTAGYEGTGTYTPPATPTPAPNPVIHTTVQEEYIRALIFQVLEEIKAAAV